MVKAAIAFLTMLIVTGKGFLMGNNTSPSITPTPQDTQVSVEENDAGFIVLVDPADLYTITTPADWKTLYLPPDNNLKSGIVAYNSDETFLMRNYVSSENTIKDEPVCGTAANGTITIEGLTTNYTECEINSSKVLTASLFRDKTYYHYLFQYNPQEFPQGSELAKTILASISFIK